MGLLHETATFRPSAGVARMGMPICQTGTTAQKNTLPSLKTESQGQLSLLVTPVTIFCLVQQFSLIWGSQEETGCKMFFSGEVDQDSPWRWEGFISFLCTIPILYYFRDQISASRAAEVAVCQTGREARHSSQTVSLNMDFACLLALHKRFAPPRTTSGLHLTLASSPHSFGRILPVSADVSTCGMSLQCWVSCSPLRFHQPLMPLNCLFLLFFPARLWDQNLTWFVVFPYLVEDLTYCGYPPNTVECTEFRAQNHGTYNLKESLADSNSLCLQAVKI